LARSSKRESKPPEKYRRGLPRGEPAVIEGRCRVLFVIPSLGGGGAERSLALVVRHIERSHFEPYLALMNVTGTYLEEIPEDVPILDLGRRSRYSFFALQWRMARLVKHLRPDVVFSSLTYCNMLVLMSRAIFRWKYPVVICEQNTLGPSLRHQRFARLKAGIIRALYPSADGIVTVSEGVRRDLLGRITASEDNAHVIYNPVDLQGIESSARNNCEGSYERTIGILAVGRLTPQKDYPTLLRAMRIVADKHEEHLMILGTGEEMDTLKQLSKELGLDRCVSFAGFVKNPYSYMARAKMLVLSSAWEGFGNVIVEAMACGTPVVATDCPSGPGEIIQDGVNGLLVPVGDERALAAAITSLLDDEELRRRLAGAAKRRAQAFGIERVTRQYEDLLVTTIRRFSGE